MAEQTEGKAGESMEGKARESMDDKTRESMAGTTRESMEGKTAEPMEAKTAEPVEVKAAEPIEAKRLSVIEGKMDALQFDAQSKKLELANINIPKIRRCDEVLVKVAFSGICGTDLHIIQVLMTLTNPYCVRTHILFSSLYPCTNFCLETVKFLATKS